MHEFRQFFSGHMGYFFHRTTLALTFTFSCSALFFSSSRIFHSPLDDSILLLYRRVPQFAGPSIRGSPNSRIIFCDPNPSIRGQKSSIRGFFSYFQKNLAGQRPKSKIIAAFFWSNQLENGSSVMIQQNYKGITISLKTG